MSPFTTLGPAPYFVNLNIAFLAMQIPSGMDWGAAWGRFDLLYMGLRANNKRSRRNSSASRGFHPTCHTCIHIVQVLTLESCIRGLCRESWWWR